MKFIPTKIEGVMVIEPDVFEDRRGFFMEYYRRDEFAKQGIRDEFLQDNHSRSAKGVLRGLHYQVPPYEQAKLVRVVRGKAFDVAVDVRPGSRTFGQYVGEVLSAENKKMMYIPAGLAHGFLSLEEGTEFLYKVSQPYSPAHERGILWDDPQISIAWPKMDTPYAFSEKDTKFPYLKKTVES